jgi:hypothetical protein
MLPKATKLLVPMRIGVARLRRADGFKITILGPPCLYNVQNEEQTMRLRLQRFDALGRKSSRRGGVLYEERLGAQKPGPQRRS